MVTPVRVIVTRFYTRLSIPNIPAALFYKHFRLLSAPSPSWTLLRKRTILLCVDSTGISLANSAKREIIRTLGVRVWNGPTTSWAVTGK